MYFSGYLIKIDIRHSSHLEKSQLNVTPPVSGGKPVFSLAIKDEKTLFTYSFNRKVRSPSTEILVFADYVYFFSYVFMIFHQRQ